MAATLTIDDCSLFVFLRTHKMWRIRAPVLVMLSSIQASSTRSRIRVRGASGISIA